MDNIVIVTIKEWNIENYFKLKFFFGSDYNFHLITDKNELTYSNLKRLNPKFIFFPHWSWIIKEEIYKSFKCIVFHMTDLPYGRGGSPFQNLILNKIYNTKISALKVSKNLDEGDIYLKEDFCIKEGSAQKLFEKISYKIFFEIIPRFLKEELIAKPQNGEVVYFTRRKESQSNILEHKIEDISDIYDFIRMLDAQSYPKAFLHLGNCKMEFSNIKYEGDSLIGTFEVLKNE